MSMNFTYEAANVIAQLMVLKNNLVPGLRLALFPLILMLIDAIIVFGVHHQLKQGLKIASGYIRCFDDSFEMKSPQYTLKYTRTQIQRSPIVTSS